VLLSPWPLKSAGSTHNSLARLTAETLH
jgi:hypothetical protein